MLVCVSDYHTIAGITSLLCSAAVIPVSPASSEPISGTASPPNPMETAPVNTTGIGTSGTCALAGLLCMYVIGERTVYTHWYQIAQHSRAVLSTVCWNGGSLRGLPLTQRTAQGQSGVTLLTRELVHFKELPHCQWRE